MARRKINRGPQGACTGVDHNQWHFDRVGDRCAVKGCSRASDGYYTTIRPGRHPVGILWHPPICTRCAKTHLMEPIPLERLRSQHDLPGLAAVLNISMDALELRL